MTCRVKIFLHNTQRTIRKEQGRKKKTAIVEANCVVSDTDTVIVNCVALMNRAAALCVTRGGNHTSYIQQLHFGFSPSTTVYLRLPSPGKPCCHGFDMVSLFRGGTPPAEAQRSLSCTLPPRSLARTHRHICAVCQFCDAPTWPPHLPLVSELTERWLDSQPLERLSGYLSVGVWRPRRETQSCKVVSPWKLHITPVL